MDSAISQFFTPGTAVLALSVVIVTFFLRRIVETALPSVKKQADENDPSITYLTLFSRWWNQVFLYAIPVVVGSALGFANVPYLFSIEELTTTGSRVLFGGVIGWLSTYLYKVLRMALKSRTGVDLPGESVPPSE
jgi:mannose/fructose/N-acetylgalactosamine-specific phosphotransferase system component IIC